MHSGCCACALNPKPSKPLGRSGKLGGWVTDTPNEYPYMEPLCPPHAPPTHPHTHAPLMHLSQDLAVMSAIRVLLVLIVDNRGGTRGVGMALLLRSLFRVGGGGGGSHG